jgi:hypothetical protein
MHRLTRYCAGWVIATTAATGVSWVAIQNLVTTAALSQPVPPAASVSTATGAPVTTAAPRATGTKKTGRASGAPAPRTSATDDRAADGQAADGQAADGRPSDQAGASTKAPTVKGYSLKGGQIVLELRPDAVELVSAVPAAGYRTETWKTEYWLRVDFVGDDGRSSVIASWYDHAPAVQETEF